MQQALELAAKGLYTTQPNPRVGCVIVKDNQVIGKGYHQKAGEAHAEIFALQEAGDNANHATAYITLEPCCYHGKTPACINALIENKIKKVIIASQDPNPKVNGQGISALKQADIDVSFGLLEAQAIQLNKGFFKRMKSGLPWVSCKLAMSLDGKTALKNGHSQWITGPDAKAKTMSLRAQHSAIITGIGTVYYDNPWLNVRDITPVTQPYRILVDSHLNLDLSANILKSSSTMGQTYVMHTNSRHPKLPILHKMNVKTIQLNPAKNGYIDTEALLKFLATELECNEVMIEAGSTLSGHMLEHEQIDELHIYLAPMIIGDQGQSLFKLPELTELSEHHQIEIKSITPLGTDWYVHAHPKY